jgi:hypothetical protein
MYGYKATTAHREMVGVSADGPTRLRAHSPIGGGGRRRYPSAGALVLLPRARFAPALS